MITIPTGDFTGILADVLPFAFPKPDLAELNTIRLEWDGEMLHAVATDISRAGWSMWAPDDDHDDDYQTDITTRWGGADEPWSVLLPYDDAQHLVKTYKLAAKEWHVPLTVEEDRGALLVKRSADTGHAAIRTDIRGRFVEFPDPREVLEARQDFKPLPALAFSPRQLADFGKVRPRGPMVMGFTGELTRTVVRIGNRFVGSIQPVEANAT